MLGAFTLLEFPKARNPEVAYLDTMAGQVFVEDDAQVKGYTAQFELLLALASPPEKSTQLIGSIGNQMSG